MSFLHNIQTPLITVVVMLGIAALAWALWTIWTYEKNRREALGHVMVTFLDEATKDEETLLCQVVDKYKVIPPGGDAKKQAKKEYKKGYYLLYGAVENQEITNDKGEVVGRYTGDVATHAIWPPGKRSRVQRIVEHVYYVKGDPRPRNPHNSFLPVNTDQVVQILGDENSLEAIFQHVKYELESLLRLIEDVKLTAKRMNFVLYGVLGGDLLLIIILILSFMMFRKGG